VRHWINIEHRIYHEDAALECPQSGERTRGRSNIQKQRASQPNEKRFSIRRITGSGELCVTELILTYHGKPSYTVSIMEFEGGKVARETRYFRMHSWLPHSALNGSNGWTRNLEAPDGAIAALGSQSVAFDVRIPAAITRINCGSECFLADGGCPWLKKRKTSA
jgi:hypothetical protein